MELCKAAGAKRARAAAGLRALPLRADAAGAGAAGRGPRGARRSATPASPLVNNVDARVGAQRRRTCRDGLVRQVSGAVRWQESIERLVREGVDHVRRGRARAPCCRGLVQEDRPGGAGAERRGPGVAREDAPRPLAGRRHERDAGRARSSLVTGASRGIGRAIARALAARGRHGGRWARATQAKLAEVVAAIASRGRPGAGASPSTWPTARRSRRRSRGSSRRTAASTTSSTTPASRATTCSCA